MMQQRFSALTQSIDPFFSLAPEADRTFAFARVAAKGDLTSIRRKMFHPHGDEFIALQARLKRERLIAVDFSN